MNIFERVKEDKIVLSEYLAGRGIWNRIRGLGPTPVPVPDTYTNEYLDTILIIDFGDRVMFDKMVVMPIEFAAQHIYNVYIDKWCRLIELAALGIGIGSDSDVVKDIKENYINKDTGDTINTNHVSAFNSDEMVPDGGDSKTRNDRNEHDLKRTEKTSTLSYNSAFNNLTATDQLAILRNVNKDIAQALTLSTY